MPIHAVFTVLPDAKLENPSPSGLLSAQTQSASMQMQSRDHDPSPSTRVSSSADPVSRTSTEFSESSHAQTVSRICSDPVRVVRFDELSEAMLARWDEVRSSDPKASDPFYASRFSAAVHLARGDVSVALISDPTLADKKAEPPSESLIGFLPFHRMGRVGVPVGRFLNDAQNVIGLPAARVDWEALTRGAEVVGFDFHAITDPQPSWIEKYGLQTVGAFRADLGGDSEAFLGQLRHDHRTIEKQCQKTRKLGREVGTLRLEIDCRCPDALKKAIAWKRDQYTRTHILDLFLPDWTRQLIEILHEPEFADGDEPAGQFQDEPLRGLLSVLWAGDQIVAAHFGMIERGRMHYWFPTYDPVYSKYSPGTALFTELLRNCSRHGIDCIDMGYGEQPYKQKQTATTTQVAFGTITESRWHRLTYHAESAFVAYAKRLPMKQQVKRIWRTLCPNAGIRKLR